MAIVDADLEVLDAYLDGALDAPEVRELTRRLAAEPELAAALALWQGPAGHGVTRGTELERRLQAVDQQRLEVVEDLADVRLTLGHTGDLVPLLREHLSAQPLRERAWAQLMLAYYRAGKPDAALATYREAHEILRRQLGVVPGPELIALRRAILGGA